jgi:hypothetical protein
MDPAHGTAQDDENFLQGMIRENEDIDINVTRTFLNDSGEGDESLNRGDGEETPRTGEKPMREKPTREKAMAPTEP